MKLSKLYETTCTGAIAFAPYSIIGAPIDSNYPDIHKPKRKKGQTGKWYLRTAKDENEDILHDDTGG